MKKKLTALFLALVMCASLCVPAFAANNSENFDDISTFESTGDVIVLKSGDDLEALHRRDLAKYNEKLANIDANLKESFENFVCQYSETNLLQEDPFENPVSSVDSALLADEFLQAYPEYNSTTYAAEVQLLSDNVVVSFVRAFFSSNDYELSLYFFDHSLIDDPEMLAFSLRGRDEDMYGYIRDLLEADPFMDLMVEFANKNSSYERLSDHSYAFEDGDLYWSIHGFTWTRSRSDLGVAAFVIDDVYDFNKWQDIPGIVAGFAGTNDYKIYISGVVQDGEIL